MYGRSYSEPLLYDFMLDQYFISCGTGSEINTVFSFSSIPGAVLDCEAPYILMEPMLDLYLFEMRDGSLLLNQINYMALHFSQMIHIINNHNVFFSNIIFCTQTSGNNKSNQTFQKYVLSSLIEII
jgi:hypothetical protein